MNRLSSYFDNEENNQPANKTNSGISSPANNTLQQSYYVAAIGKFTGHEGLQSPVTDMYEGERYTFNFFCPETMHLFKVLSLDELDQYDKYLQYPGDKNIIIDLELNGEPVYTAEVEGQEFIIVSREVMAQLHTPDLTVLYCDQQLWELDEVVDELGYWSPIVPVVLLEQETDEDDEE